MKEIEAILKTVHLNKQYRDKTKKVKFNLGWAFLLGNTTNALGAGAFTTPHNFKRGKGVCIKPVEGSKAASMEAGSMALVQGSHALD